jgi:sec-independent protein translocase protein TatA
MVELAAAVIPALLFLPLGPWELLLIFVAVLLLFGAKRLPEIAQGLGKGIREFKKAMKDTTAEIQSSLDDDSSKDDNSGKKNT